MLDEPTQGLDAHTKKGIGKIIRELSDSGVTVVIVSHDVEFAAALAHRCGLLFRGTITSVGTPREFFSRNSFYTTAISRMTRGIFENAVTEEAAEALCRLNGRVKSADG